MNDVEITFWKYTGSDGEGGRTYLAGAAAIGKYVERHEKIVDAWGSDTTSDAAVYTEFEMTTNDVIELGTANVGQAQPSTGSRNAKKVTKTPESISPVRWKSWL